jgi:hypothetical protein
VVGHGETGGGRREGRSGGASADGAPALTKSGQYAAALGRWAPYLWREPNGLMCGSLLFALTCLPIVTAGPAWLALCHYMDARERGVRVPWWRGACAMAFREAGARAWLMGLTDMLALAMAGGCALVLLDGGMPAAVLLAYAIMLVCDLIYLLSGMYRYPALAAEPGNRLALLAARGFLMALANMGWTLMFAFAQLLAFMLCALTGVGLLLLFPAAAALLSARAYASMAKLYGLSPRPPGSRAEAEYDVSIGGKME